MSAAAQSPSVPSQRIEYMLADEVSSAPRAGPPAPTGPPSPDYTRQVRTCVCVCLPVCLVIPRRDSHQASLCPGVRCAGKLFKLHSSMSSALQVSHSKGMSSFREHPAKLSPYSQRSSQAARPWSFVNSPVGSHSSSRAVHDIFVTGHL